jgi:hypothetical protein
LTRGSFLLAAASLGAAAATARGERDRRLAHAEAVVEGIRSIARLQAKHPARRAPAERLPDKPALIS